MSCFFSWNAFSSSRVSYSDDLTLTSVTIQMYPDVGWKRLWWIEWEVWCLFMELFVSFPASQDAAHDMDTLQRYKVSAGRSMRRAYPCLLASHVQWHEITEASMQGCSSAFHVSECLWKSRSGAVTVGLSRGSSWFHSVWELQLLADMWAELCSGCSGAPGYCCLCSLRMMNWRLVKGFHSKISRMAAFPGMEPNNHELVSQSQACL